MTGSEFRLLVRRLQQLSHGFLFLWISQMTTSHQKNYADNSVQHQVKNAAM